MNPLLKLADLWEKEGAAYSKIANVQDGSKPDDMTPVQQGLVSSAGTYRVCAKALREMVTKMEKDGAFNLEKL